jgi:hypothetical protein
VVARHPLSSHRPALGLGGLTGARIQSRLPDAPIRALLAILVIAISTRCCGQACRDAYSAPVFRAGANIRGSGRRVQSRRSRSHATRPQGAL